MKKQLIVMMALLWSVPAMAVENGAPLDAKLDEVVVTATRGEQQLADSPGSVEVITKKNLKNRNSQSLDGALRSVPGLYSRRELEFSTLQPVINIRGIAGQNRTLVMVDGITLNEPRTGAGYFDGISVDDVDRIEVVKGPFSSLYGGYAMGGVINVITKMPEKREINFKSGYGNAWNSGEGFRNVFSEYISYGDRINKLSLFASYSRKWTDGYPYQQNVQSLKPPTSVTGYETTSNNAGAVAYNIGDKGDGRSWNDGLSLKAQYDFTSDTRLGLSYLRNNTRTDYGRPNTVLSNAAGTPVFTYTNGSTVREASYLATASGRTRSIYNMTFETALGSVKTKLQGGLVDQEESYNRSPGSGASTTYNGGPGTWSDSPAKEYYADLQFSAPLFSNQILTWGGSYRHDETDSENYNLSNWNYEDTKTALTSTTGGDSRTYAFFVQDEIQLLDNLTGYIGGRLDWWRAYDGYNSTGDIASGSEFCASPKAALVYKPFDKTTLRASGGKAFRPPTLYELYSNYVGTYTTNANPNLKPETTWSWDVSFDQGLWGGAKVKFAYFENYMSDMIYTAGTGAVRDRQNVGKAESSGFEVGLEQQIGQGFRIFGDYTYTDATITKNRLNPATEEKRMIDVPKNMFNVGVEGEYGHCSGSLVGRYVGKRYANDANTDTENHVYGSYDPFFTADAKVSYAVGQALTLSLSVNNIFDKEYYTYYRSPGRSYFMEAALKF